MSTVDLAGESGSFADELALLRAHLSEALHGAWAGAGPGRTRGVAGSRRGGMTTRAGRRVPNRRAALRRRRRQTLPTSIARIASPMMKRLPNPYNRYSHCCICWR